MSSPSSWMCAVLITASLPSPLSACSASMESGIYREGFAYAERAAERGHSSAEVQAACEEMRETVAHLGSTDREVAAWFAGCQDARAEVFDE